MKKSIIALAVAGAMTAPIIAQADATIYGRVHERLVFQEDKDVDIQNAGARFGVKGSSEMDSGLTAFYNIELEFFGDTSRGDEDDAQTRQSNSSRSSGANDVTFRQLHAGVKGDFGTVKIGRFTNPYVDTYTADVFEGESGVFQIAPFRIGNAVSYDSPTFNGFSASATIIGEAETPDGADDSQYEDVDGYVLKGKGEFGPVTVALAYMDTDYGDATIFNGSGELELTSVGVSYDANGLYVGLSYEEDDVSDKDVVDFSAAYKVGKTTFGLGYAVEDEVGDAEKTRTLLGVYHQLGGSADVYTELARYDETDASDNDKDYNRFSVGYRVKF